MTDDQRPNQRPNAHRPSTNEQRPACITLKPMPLKIYRLRRLLAGTAVLLTLVVAGMYSYARWRGTNVLKQNPGKIGYDIQEKATRFQFFKTYGQRTPFTLQTSDLKEVKL